MRNYVLLSLFCSSLFFGACAQGKKTAKAPATNSTSGSGTEKVAADAKPGRDITSLTMRRTGCFGRCPIYEVELFADGRARYIGERFTDHLGTFEKNVGAANVQAVLRQAQTLRVDTAAAEYEMIVQDLPGLTFTFTRPQGTQKVQNANFGPRYFVSLSNAVDGLVQVDGTWRKTAPAKED